MSILYAVVSQGPIVLARYSACAGNFQEVADQILSQVTASGLGPRMTFTHDSYLTHYITSHDVTYLCITDKDYDRCRSFVFLGDIKDKFQAVYRSAPREPAPYVWNDAMAEVLRSSMEYHNNNSNEDKVSAMRSQVEDVQQTLVRNIEEIASRGERLELLVDKTNNLNTGAVSFRTGAQQVHRKAWWTNARTWLYLLIAVGLSIYLLGAAICGLSWQRCVAQ